MLNQFQKYSVLVFAISILNLKFFLLSPFFHHHHNTELNDHSIIQFHSHLFTVSGSDHDSAAGKNFTARETDHNHFDQVNLQNFISTQRNYILVQTSDNAYVCSSIYEINDQKVTVKPGSNDFIQFQQDKYVHSAANVSPPLV